MDTHIISEAEQLDEASVLADELLAENDPRGELLALEVASVRASSVEQARTLNKRANELLWDEPRHYWPSSFAPATAKLRAGFVVEIAEGFTGQLKEAAPLPCMRGLRYVGGWRMDELEHEYARVCPAWVSTTILPTDENWDDLGVLLKLRRLQQLDLGLGRGGPHHETFERLVELPELRALSLSNYDRVTLELLADLRLTHLRLNWVRDGHLDTLGALARLRHLQINFANASRALVLAKLPLDSLRIRLSLAPKIWAEMLDELSLRQLRVEVWDEDDSPAEMQRWREAHARLGPRLECLDVDLARIDTQDLFGLPKLRELTLRGPGELETLPALERLSLSVDALVSLRELSSPALTVLEGADKALDWGQLSAIQGDVALRELDLRLPLGTSLSEVAMRALAEVEHLTLVDPPGQALRNQLKRLPNLRRLTVTNMGVGHHRELVEQMDEVLAESTRMWPRRSTL